VSGRAPARRLAIDILYEADVTKREPGAVLEQHRELDRAVPSYTETLVHGVAQHSAEIDLLLGEHAEGWAVHRMAPVDRTILRVACYEILHRDEVPVAVAIDEAVQAAKRLGQDESKGFVNGILGRIARENARSS